MKVLKALLATIGVFGVSIFLSWVSNQGVYGEILLWASVFLMVFTGFYCIINNK